MTADTMQTKQPLLAVEKVETYYGNIRALKGIDLTVNEGEIVALIGANGAGKSTLMMTIFGSPRARTGRILFGGKDITSMPPHEIAKLRIAQSPEGRRIFPRMTVLENLQMGASLDHQQYFEEDVALMFELFPRLKERINQRGGTLSGGEQQMLAIARGLMSKPVILLLDEPSLGLAPKIIDELFEALDRLRAESMTILLVDQMAALALSLADRAYVLESGRVAAQGTAEEIAQDGALARAYLGA